jgi:hypothetical protein
MLHDDTNRTMPEIQNIVYLFVWVLAVLAMPLEVVFHYAFGNRYLRFGALLSACTTCLLGAMAYRLYSGKLAIGVAGVIYMITCFRAYRAKHSTLPVHAYYSGYPWLCNLSNDVTEQEVKTALEPPLAAWVGIFLEQYDWRVSAFLWISAAALFLKNMISPDAGQYQPKQTENRPQDRRAIEQFRNRV